MRDVNYIINIFKEHLEKLLKTNLVALLCTISKLGLFDHVYKETKNNYGSLLHNWADICYLSFCFYVLCTVFGEMLASICQTMIYKLW